jgi:small subunit ribosomal protein S8
MFVNDILSDMIARINNAQRASLAHAKVINSKLSVNVLKILHNEGFIEGYSIDEENKNQIIVTLKYDLGKPIINVLKRISKPGRRVYSKIGDLPKYFNGLGIGIVSTPKGVIADHEARKLKVGGEILCVVF